MLLCTIIIVSLRQRRGVSRINNMMDCWIRTLLEYNFFFYNKLLFYFFVQRRALAFQACDSPFASSRSYNLPIWAIIILM